MIKYQIRKQMTIYGCKSIKTIKTATPTTLI
jgi:hypothetical protein